MTLPARCQGRPCQISSSQQLQPRVQADVTGVHVPGFGCLGLVNHEPYPSSRRVTGWIVVSGAARARTIAFALRVTHDRPPQCHPSWLCTPSVRIRLSFDAVSASD